jgi:hypothetical protein
MNPEDKKKDYSVPGWVITHWHNISLDMERAQKLHDMRLRLCEKLGKHHEACKDNNLWIHALDLLLDHEEEYIAEYIMEDIFNKDKLP